MLHRKTEEEVARVEHELQDLDEEIRRLEYLARVESEYDMRGTAATPPQVPGFGSVPAPEYGGGGLGYGVPPYGAASGYGMPMISPLAGPYVFPQQPGNWSTYAYNAGYQMAPSGYYMQQQQQQQPYFYPVAIPPSIGQQPPQPFQQSSMGAEVQTRQRSGTQTLEDLQAMSAKKSGTRPDLGVALRSSAWFTLSLIGEAAFFMIRDWFDTTKSRARAAKDDGFDMDDPIAMAALDELEKGGKTLTKQQKMRHVKSVRQLMRATSVRQVISGLRDTGRGSEAESLARRLLAIRRQMYGEAHMATAQALNQLGNVLVQGEEYSEAVEAFEDALKVARAAMKYKKKPPVEYEARILHNLACANALAAKETPEDQEEMRNQALALGLQCVALCESRLGPNHARTIKYKRIWVPGFAEELLSKQPEIPKPSPSPVDLVLMAAVSTKEE